MASAPKILGQYLATSGSQHDLYTVPAATKTTVSSIVICNLSGTAKTFRITVAVNGAADNNKHYLYYELPIESHDTFIATIGATLGAGDVIRVTESTGSSALAFNAFGIETT